MVAPKTYCGYNSEGKQICSATAENANEYINPDEVRAAIDNFNEVVETNLNNLSSALLNVEPDTEEAIIVQGTKMTETIESLCTTLKQLAGQFADSIEFMYSESVKAHDEIQNQANTNAKNSVTATEGVVRVS